jgi:hypothetical protein
VHSRCVPDVRRALDVFFAEQRLAVVAAQQAGEPVQVGAQPSQVLPGRGRRTRPGERPSWSGSAASQFRGNPNSWASSAAPPMSGVVVGILRSPPARRLGRSSVLTGVGRASGRYRTSSSGYRALT